MTDLQPDLAIGLPSMSIVASLIISLCQMSGLREHFREVRADLKSIVSKLGAMDVELTKLMNK